VLLYFLITSSLHITNEFLLFAGKFFCVFTLVIPIIHKYFCLFYFSLPVLFAVRVYNIENMRFIFLFHLVIFYQLSTVFSTNFGMFIGKIYSSI